MEFILFVLIACSFIYSNYKYKKLAGVVVDLSTSIGELSDKQSKVVVEFFVEKLTEKGVLHESEVGSFYDEINQRIRTEVKTESQITAEGKAKRLKLVSTK